MFVTRIEMKEQIQKISGRKTCQVSVIVQMCVKRYICGSQVPRNRDGLRDDESSVEEVELGACGTSSRTVVKYEPTHIS